MPFTPTSTLINNVATMTRHRDHGLLDVALIQTLIMHFARGLRRFEARLFRVATDEKGVHLTLHAWNRGAQVYCEEQMLDDVQVPGPLLEAVKHQAMQFTEERLSGGRSYGCWLPVTHEGQVLACLEIHRSRPLGQRQLALAGGVLTLYGNYLSLLRYSETDTLTRLLNRKTFEESLRRLLDTGSRAAPLAPDQERRRDADTPDHWLAVLDIDRFKAINDQYGHLFGDEVLILVADEMRRVFRRQDKLFRFGGEEFVVILRHTSERHAARVFERFRRAVESRDFPQVGRVTVSVGATRILPWDSPTTVLGRADDALYFVKNHGRNQLCFHEALIAAGRLRKPDREMAVELF